MFLQESHAMFAEEATEGMVLNLEDVSDIMTEAEEAYANINQQAMLEQYAYEKETNFNEAADETSGFKATIKRWWANIREFFAKLWANIKKFFSAIFLKITGTVRNDVKWCEGLKKAAAEASKSSNTFTAKVYSNDGVAVAKELNTVASAVQKLGANAVSGDSSGLAAVGASGSIEDNDGTLKFDASKHTKATVKAALGEKGEVSFECSEASAFQAETLTFLKAATNAESLRKAAEKTISGFEKGLKSAESEALSSDDKDVQAEGKKRVANTKVMTSILKAQMSIAAKIIGAKRSDCKAVLSKMISAAKGPADA